MHLNLSSAFFSIEQLVEYCYLIGMHEEARGLSELANCQDLFSLIENSYSDKEIFTSKSWEEYSNSMTFSEFPTGLMPAENYSYLSFLAFELPSNAKILEVGTLLGRSTLALCEGSLINNAMITCIDAYMGFQQANTNIHTGQPLNWEYNYWQTNLRAHSRRLNSIRASAASALRELAMRGEKYDLIFLDAAHTVETFLELSYISLLANEGCTFVADDIVNWSTDVNSDIMTSAWAAGLKNFFCFPRFFGNLAVASFKADMHPSNISFTLSPENARILRKAVNYAIENSDLSTFSFQ